MFFWIVWQAIYLPFKLCFDTTNLSSESLIGLDYAIDLCFGIDMLINFNTGYYKNGVLIMNRKLIVINYMKSWFWMDLIATFPYVYVIQWVSPIP
jgi:hyperpolarization activated cyclic nucleotide-gated potassium channel 2